MIQQTVNKTLDVALDALADRYRRRLLVALLEHNPQDPDDSLAPRNVTAEAADREQHRVTMTHVHLPKLEDAGFIEWDRETNEVSKGSQFDEIRPLLQLMHDHADELPDEWL